MAYQSTKLYVQRQHEKGSKESLDFEFIPGITTLRDALESARLLFDAKNLWFACPSNAQAALQYLYFDEAKGNMIGVPIIGESFQNDDTAALVPVSKEGSSEEAFQVCKITFPKRRASAMDLLSHKLNMYHALSNVCLVEKPAIRYVDVQVNDKRIRFFYPSQEQDPGTKPPAEASHLASDSLQALHQGICTAFGLSSSTSSKRRLSLFSPKDGSHWFEDPQGWERTHGVRLHELGLSGPTLEGRFDELSLVLVKTTIAGKTIALRVRLCDTVDLVKTKLHDIIGIPAEQQELFFQNSIMENHRSLAQHGVAKRSLLHLGLSLPPKETDSSVRSRAESKPTSPLSLNLVLPGNRREKIQVDPARPVAMLLEFASGKEENDSDDGLAAPCVSIEEAYTSSSTENKCQKGSQHDASKKEAPSSKDQVDRAKRTIDNAIQSILSFNRKHCENENVRDKDMIHFGEI